MACGPAGDRCSLFTHRSLCCKHPLALTVSSRLVRAHFSSSSNNGSLSGQYAAQCSYNLWSDSVGRLALRHFRREPHDQGYRLEDYLASRHASVPRLRDPTEGRRGNGTYTNIDPSTHREAQRSASRASLFRFYLRTSSVQSAPSRSPNPRGRRSSNCRFPATLHRPEGASRRSRSRKQLANTLPLSAGRAGDRRVRWHLAIIHPGADSVRV